MRPIFILLIIFHFACNKQTGSVQQQDTPNITETKSDSLDHETIIASMDNTIRETSGLALIDGAHWTINDSGNDPSLYQFDISTGKITSEVKISDAENQDWESLTQDNEHIYIGDFGNNTGGRDNLRIYKVDLNKLMSPAIGGNEAITFHYPDQKKFYSGYDHNFDCEAMVSKGDSLYLFSKNWQDRKCKLYGLSKDPVDQTASLISEFDAGGTITGASLHQSKKELYLLGYNGIGVYSSFIWVIKNWEGSDLFAGTKKKYQLTIDRQTEGISVTPDGSLLISAEAARGGNPSLYRVSLD